jgi:hypothetical protein
MITIPLPTDEADSFTQRTRLEGVDYTIRYSHNSRSDSWTFDLAAIGGNNQEPIPIVTGMKIFIGNNLLRYASHELAPPGVLLALSADGSRRAPTQDELGSRVRLYYLAAGETFP